MKVAIFTEDKNIFIHLMTEMTKQSTKLTPKEIQLLSTSELENKEISYKDTTLTIENINSYKDFNNTNFAIFSVRKELTEKYIYDFIENNCVVLDDSGHFIKDNNIPTVDFSINPQDIKKYKNKNIIKLPSRNTLQLAEILNILKQHNPIEKVVVSTYQSTASISKDAMDELYLHTKKIYENSFLSPIHFKKQIPFNVLPQMGNPTENNHYEEENRIMAETKQLIDKKLKISTTCALVPTFNGDCQSLHIEFQNNINLNKINEILENKPEQTTIQDRFEDFNYATPKEVALEDTIFISRIRKDIDQKNALNLWTVADSTTIHCKNIINRLNFLLAK